MTPLRSCWRWCLKSNKFQILGHSCLCPAAAATHDTNASQWSKGFNCRKVGPVMLIVLEIPLQHCRTRLFSSLQEIFCEFLLTLVSGWLNRSHIVVRSIAYLWIWMLLLSRDTKPLAAVRRDPAGGRSSISIGYQYLTSTPSLRR